ncbi:MAG: cysteine synthase A [Clostridia bacterium]|nr:cysteine synthase A [Clostridia bacterium]
MRKIAGSIIDLIGNTPLLELENFSINKKIDNKIIAKVESANPGSSVKDRLGLALIKSAEEKGILKPGSVIIEPTSGNTGIALAYISAARGYRLILTMPETMSVERRNLLKAFGAELVLTPGSEGMAGAISKAEELIKDIPGSYMPQQFNNPSNPEMHYKTTGPEIWEDTEGKIDYFVAGVGTGGTVSGVAKYLKEKNPNVKIVAVEPEESAVLSGKEKGPHKIQGIGAGFVPLNFNKDLIDEIIPVSDDAAAETSRTLAKTEGLLAGISSGAALYAALKISEREENKDLKIVVLLPDSGERYLSTGLFDQE